MRRKAKWAVWVLFAGLFAMLATEASAQLAKTPRKKPGEGLPEWVKERRIDNRQDHQRVRITHGIRKGFLTSDEVAKLETQQKTIADLEANCKADGKLTRDDMRSLRTALDEASRCIWAEKHDTDGKQMPVYRLGRNIFATDLLTSKLGADELPRAEARVLLKDFHRTVQLKHTLATKDLPDNERAKLQAEFNELLNKYFEVREEAAAKK